MTGPDGLKLAVVLRAIEDAQGKVSAKDLRSMARIREDALCWIKSRSREHPMTFERICENFGYNPSKARAHLLRRLSQNGVQA